MGVGSHGVWGVMRSVQDLEKLSKYFLSVSSVCFVSTGVSVLVRLRVKVISCGEEIGYFVP